MKLFNINNTSSFFERILECAGNVYYRDDQGEMHDLKELARQFSACKGLWKSVRIDELDVIAEEPSDCIRLCHCMMEAR